MILLLKRHCFEISERLGLFILSETTARSSSWLPAELWVLEAAFCTGILLTDWDFSLSPDLVAQRGEKLELLIDKTENLVDSVSLGKNFKMGN